MPPNRVQRSISSSRKTSGRSYSTSRSSLTPLPDQNDPLPPAFTEIVSSTAQAPTRRFRIGSCELVADLQPYDMVWKFIAERMAIDARRRAGIMWPWTNDPDLQRWSWCHAYRVLDRVSQYIVTDVIQKGSQTDEEVVFRVILFNTFTKIETWELLKAKLGEISWTSYDRDKYDRILGNANVTLYTKAFQKPAPPVFGYKTAFENHLSLLEEMMRDDFPLRLKKARSLRDAFSYIAGFPGMADFTSYQLLLNLSYSNVLKFSANDFVVPGPGCDSGLGKIFGNSLAKALKHNNAIKSEILLWMTKNQEAELKRLNLPPIGLGPDKRPLELPDMEHIICEVDKLCRLKLPLLEGGNGNKTVRAKYKPEELKQKQPIPHLPAIPCAWSHKRPTLSRPSMKRVKIQKRYFVEKIDDERLDENEQLMYLVKWLGYSDTERTWEPAHNIQEDAPDPVQSWIASKRQR